MRKYFYVLVIMTLLVIGCGGPMKVGSDSVSGSTYSESMVFTAAQANAILAYAANPAAFDYKCPFDPTDKRDSHTYRREFVTEENSTISARNQEAQRLKNLAVKVGKPRGKK